MLGKQFESASNFITNLRNLSDKVLPDANFLQLMGLSTGNKRKKAICNASKIR